MMNTIIPDRKTDLEDVILVEVFLDGEYHGPSAHDEMVALIHGVGGKIVDTVSQRRSSPDSSRFIGKGKVEEIKLTAESAGSCTLVFDHNLNPGQVAKLEKLTSCKVIDRTELILAIFAEHARSREAKLQIELAQLSYVLPRLTKMWHHLSRLEGGIGTRGPGETQLEVDKRRARYRIRLLKKQLLKIESQSELRSKRRINIFKIALVGYTNSGKSTLLNTLCNADVLSADQVFATLDSTSRKLEFPLGGSVLVSDTVGFIERIPEKLIASFRTTLNVVRKADLILLISDLSNPDRDFQLKVVKDTLVRIGAGDIPRVIVWNKSDLLEKNRQPDTGVVISALTGEGIDRLTEEIKERWGESLEWFELETFSCSPDLESWLRKNCHLRSINRCGEGFSVIGGMRFNLDKLRSKIGKNNSKLRLTPITSKEAGHYRMIDTE